jgi:hypothetical protein
MDKELQQEIARKGGRAAHESGNAHEFTPEEARAAGRRGGRSVSRDRQHMAEIGRKGGEAAHAKGTAHEWNKKEAAAAGRRGGQRAHPSEAQTTAETRRSNGRAKADSSTGSRRGFATMNSTEQRKTASKGGRTRTASSKSGSVRGSRGK